MKIRFSLTSSKINRRRDSKTIYIYIYIYIYIFFFFFFFFLFLFLLFFFCFCFFVFFCCFFSEKIKVLKFHVNRQADDSHVMSKLVLYQEKKNQNCGMLSCD